MKRILIMIDTLNGGGAEKALKNLLDNLDDKKYKIDLLLIYKQGVYLEEIEKKYKVMALNKGREKLSNNVILRKIKTLYLKCKTSILSSKLISNKIIPDEYDIEIAFLEGQSTRFIANRKNRAKKIAWIHTDLKKHRNYNKNDEEYYENFEDIIAVSKDSANGFKNLYPMYSDKIKVIYNPINVEEIIINSQEVCLEYEKTNVNLINVGRLSYEKGHDILLQAHKQVIERGYKYNLYLLGEGREKKRITAYIQDNKLQETVKLLGFKKNPYPYIANSDGFIMSSRYEGLPLVLCEALVLGKPIIATRCTGPMELLENGKYGLMVECENVDDLSQAIEQLIIDKQKREDYSKLSLERAEIFKLDKTIREVENLLDKI